MPVSLTRAGIGATESLGLPGSLRMDRSSSEGSNQCLGLSSTSSKGLCMCVPGFSFGHAKEAEFRIPSKCPAHCRFSNHLTQFASLPFV